MSRYEVIGKRAYLEHPPGAVFEASLPADMEARAVAAGALRVLDTSPVTLQPGTVRLPDGWTTNRSED